MTGQQIAIAHERANRLASLSGRELLETYDSARRAAVAGYESALVALEALADASDIISRHNVTHPHDRVAASDLTFAIVGPLRCEMQAIAAKHHQAADQFARAIGYR